MKNSVISFLKDPVGKKKSVAIPTRGLTADDSSLPEACRRTAGQNVAALELMLGQIANFCPVISRNTIIKGSSSLNSIWQAIRLHFGFQSTGAHFLDLCDIKFEVGEKPENLFQHISAFVEDNLLLRGTHITHHGGPPECDEEMSPTLENFVVLTWLRLINSSLPRLVKQRYGTEFPTRTLASIKPEISLALSSLLDELQSVDDANILHSNLVGGRGDGFNRGAASIRRRNPRRVHPVSHVHCVRMWAGLPLTI